MREKVKAKFDTKCKGCGQPIAQGDPIGRSDQNDYWRCARSSCLKTWRMQDRLAHQSSTKSVVTAGQAMQHAQGASKSCLTCPSYLKTEETEGFFKKNAGMPMCAQFGKVLGQPGMKAVQESIVAEKTAAGCNAHGKPRPISPPEFLDTMVASPMVDVLVQGQTDGEEVAERVSTCQKCDNYIPPSVVRAEMGWPQGLCAATGRILLENRLKEEAKNCTWRRRGYGKRTTSGMTVIPIFGDAFAYDPDPVKAFLARKGQPVVDPSEYPTDRPVTDDEREDGIRAWRRIMSPDGSGRYVDLPIFDIASLPESDQVLVPRTGDDDHPEWYVDVNGYVYDLAVAMMELDETPVLSGQPGVGKTELARHLAWLMCLPFVRISLNERSEVEDLIGQMQFSKERGTYFEPGRVVRAWERNCVLLLDEPNTAPDGVWQRIRPMTDNSKQLALDEAGGSLHDRAAFCFFIMAMNPSWDARNIGAKELAAADRDRLDHHYIELPPREIEKEIIRTRCKADGYDIPEEDLDKVLAVAADIRALVAEHFPISWGIRPNIKVARKLRWYDPIKAYKIAVTNDLEPETGDQILEKVRSQWSV